MVMPETAVEKVVAEPESWSKVEAELQLIVGGSSLGKRLFGFALQLILGESVAKIIARTIDDNLSKPTKIEPEDVLRCKRSANKAVQELDQLDALPDRQEISVLYRGRPLRCGWRASRRKSR